jgi:hypothetical protein
MMVSNLKDQVTAWFVTKQGEIADISEFAAELRKEFLPEDIQERLRDALFQLRQRDQHDLAEYVTEYRQLISRVHGMGDLDKNTFYTRGLVSMTRAEVVYSRCKTVHEAISVAVQYERSHPTNYAVSRVHRPHVASMTVTGSSAIKDVIKSVYFTSLGITHVVTPNLNLWRLTARVSSFGESVSAAIFASTSRNRVIGFNNVASARHATNASVSTRSVRPPRPVTTMKSLKCLTR